MKSLLVALLVSGQIGLVYADVVIEAGEDTFVFSDSDKDSEMVKDFTKIAEIHKGAQLTGQKREQLKDELGLGELERMTVSSSKRPGYDEIKMFRGANTDQLFSLLENEHFAGYWLVIARTIGMVADEPAAKRLADFAASPFSDDEAMRVHHIAAREGAVWGLTFATRDQPMPWVREFLISHADAEQWIEDFGDVELDRRTAGKLADNTLRAISRVGSDESLAMLKEVREKHVSEETVRPQSVKSAKQGSESELDYINIMIDQTQVIAKGRAEQAK